MASTAEYSAMSLAVYGDGDPLPQNWVPLGKPGIGGSLVGSGLSYFKN